MSKTRVKEVLFETGFRVPLMLCRVHKGNSALFGYLFEAFDTPIGTLIPVYCPGVKGSLGLLLHVRLYV